MRTPSMANLRVSSRAPTPSSTTTTSSTLDQSSSTAIQQLLASGAVRVNFLTGKLEVIEGSQLPGAVPSVPRVSPMKDPRDINPDNYAQPFLDFINENPTVFHAVHYFEERLEKEGFQKLSERNTWEGTLRKGGKYYLTRNGSSLVAFTIPEHYSVGDGVAMIAGHIDAVTARLKPISKKPNTAGYLQLGVAPYAGGLNSTWWDRDLGLGGRVIVKNADGTIQSRLVRLDWPVARISTLAPHFGAPANGPFNTETQMVPAIGLESDEDDQRLLPEGTFVSNQPARLVKAIAQELKITDYSNILNWDLELYEFAPGQLGGLSKELIFAPRIDDKLCSFGAFEGLLETSKDLSTRSTISLCALFDNEEIGSRLRQGAMGNLLSGTVERIVESFSGGKSYVNTLSQTYAKSFLVSADVTHAVNPNFLSSYLPDHAPRLNVGITIAADPNGHMTTDGVSSALFQRIADKAGQKVQVFQIRNDSRSGGTVGPMLSTNMGVRAIDVGMAQLSMHSVRAACGAKDPGLMAQIAAAFYEYFEEVDGEFKDE